MAQLLFLGNVGTTEIIIIALVVVLLFGGKKIPELMGGIGKGVRSFKKGMNEIEEEINKDALEYAGHQERIFNHYSDYPGSCFTEKLLRDEQVRRQLQMPNSHKAWLAYCSDNLRRMNRKNMKLIGIPEEEVLAFTDARAEVAIEEEAMPD